MEKFDLHCSPNHKEVISHPMTVVVLEDEVQSRFMQLNQHIHCTTLTEPLPERLKVKECIHFWCKWFNASQQVDTLISRFNLTSIQNVKIANIDISNLKLLHLVRISLSQHPHILIKEPIQRVSIEHKVLIMKHLQRLSAHATIVCLTNHAEEALLLTHNIYRYNQQGFKPIETDTQIDRDYHKDPVHHKLQRLSIKVNDKLMLIDPIDIDYIESRNGKVLIFVNQESYVHDATLSTLEVQLKHYGFFRCHRSYLINLQKVSEIITWSKNSYSLRLNHNKEQLIPLSRQKLSDITHFFNLTS